MSGRVLTCVYCGHEYPQETPAWGNDVLTEGQALAKAAALRTARRVEGSPA